MAGDDGLELAKSIYKKAYERQDELCGPYATVIDINTRLDRGIKNTPVLIGVKFNSCW